uniref:Uncharacterized protein n=1 Tax=Anguilla anguilla TaxID=7936 RepID=A0A0E9XM07_ANGAN
MTQKEYNYKHFKWAFCAYRVCLPYADPLSFVSHIHCEFLSVKDTPTLKRKQPSV